MGAPVNPSFSQDMFRFRNDDNNQILATWIANENTNINIKSYITFRCRFAINQTVSSANTNLARNFKLRYSLNGGTYTDVGAQGSQSVIRYADSKSITDNEATTNLILVSASTFVAGSVDENGDTGTITFTSGALSFTEVEFVLNIYGGLLNPSDTLDLRVYETNNTALAAYTQTARVRKTRRLRVMG